MNEMAIDADNVNVAVNKVNELSVQNKDSIMVLVQEVSKFKVASSWGMVVPLSSNRCYFQTNVLK
jgi:hypothetical protein